LVAEHPVERRLRREVLAAIGKRRHDLLRRTIGKLRRVRDAEQALPLGFGELIGRRVLRTDPTVAATRCPTPTLERTGRDADLVTSALQGEARLHGFLDRPCELGTEVVAMSSSSSPQRAASFFRSTSRAAVSASALSFSASSLRSSAISRSRSASALSTAWLSSACSTAVRQAVNWTMWTPSLR